MKTQRFSYLAGFAARELMREAKPVKLKKVACSHFFDTLKAGLMLRFLRYAHINNGLRPYLSAVFMLEAARKRIKEFL